ncbi:hypothetical protein [Motilibacter aurantiacus]|uniref:hypothetical protein n=1 Tax=Motilibacter aurantiacus TaxID=2714955 RepID=UPI001409351B|nr:hypothetical protein [Motilibacter aurantiacus]NHC45670.1 hypothetical protein [Motilibacter aurantiacus]
MSETPFPEPPVTPDPQAATEENDESLYDSQESVRDRVQGTGVSDDDPGSFLNEDNMGMRNTDV